MAKNPGNRGGSRIIASALAIGAGMGIAFAGKQRLILQVREPLRSGHVSIVLPAVTNARGEIRDLKTTGPAADSLVEDSRKDKGEVATDLVLDMTLRSAGRNALEVFITLPEPAFVELFLMDHNGKILGTLLTAQLTRGVHPVTVALKDNESGGPGIIALRVGKRTIQRLFSQVKG